MMTVTEAAARAINSLVAKNQMPDTAGLRIWPAGQTTRSEGLGLSIAAAPADDDTVLETHGATVFLASTVKIDVEGGDEELRFFVERRREHH